MRRLAVLTTAAALALSACGSGDDESSADQTSVVTGSEPSGADPATSDAEGGPEAVQDFTSAERGTFGEGWAMAFVDDDHLIITERGGALKIRDQRTGDVRDVTGAPEVHHAGQAGLHDVVTGPTFAEDGTIYLGWVRPHEDGAQGVVGRGTLDLEEATLTDLDVIWEQTPESGDGHFSLRMLVQDDHLFVTSGDRQKMTPAQSRETNLGKVLRLTLDGKPAPGNPWADEGGVAAEIWTMGHRNPLGIDDDAQGRVWVSEMGPQGGDELNLLEAGENYGWPEASMGVHYGGEEIPDHTTGDGYRGPEAYWVPSISPGSLLIYSGDLFEGWQGAAILGGLSGELLARVALDGETASKAGEWDMGARIRAVDEAPDGSLWVLEDGDGRLLELRPR